MVEYFVTKGKLVVRNGAPLVVLDGEEKCNCQVGIRQFEQTKFPHPMH